MRKGYFLAPLIVFVLVLLLAPKLHDLPKRPYYSVETFSLPKANDCHHAVVCGGVHSVEEARKALGDLYRVFDFGSAQERVLPADYWARVSYLKDGKIYITKKLIRIRAGEKVLQDQNGLTILERCGNLASLSPMFPASESEPGDIYPPDVTPPTEAPPSLPTPPNVPVPPTPPSPPQPPGPPPPNCCIIPPSPPPIVTVPEPATVYLLLMGLAVLLGLSRLAVFVRKREER